jgi:hypothetical protein
MQITNSTQSIANGIYYIRNAFSGHYLQVPNGQGNGTQCNQWSFVAGTTFQWRVERIGLTDEFTLTPMHNTNLRLNATGVENNRAVTVTTANNNVNQRWRFVRNNSGSISLVSVGLATTPRRFLTVPNANVGAGIVTHEPNYVWQGHDEWFFEPINSFANITYQTRVQNMEVFETVNEGDVGGTTGYNFSMRDFRIVQFNNLPPNMPNASMRYRARLTTHGQSTWRDWVTHGQWATNQPVLNIDGIQIELVNMTGWNVFYRTHSINFGWSGWHSNGQTAGQLSGSVDAIQIVVMQGNIAGSTQEISANAFRATEARGFDAFFDAYWDGGFDIRVNHNINAVNTRINYYNAGLITAFARQNIRVIPTQVSRQRLTSPADRCRTPNVNTQCTCNGARPCANSVICGNRCKNAGINHAALPLRTSNVASVGIIGHFNCNWFSNSG